MRKDLTKMSLSDILESLDSKVINTKDILECPTIISILKRYDDSLTVTLAERIGLGNAAERQKIETSLSMTGKNNMTEILFMYKNLTSKPRF